MRGDRSVTTKRTRRAKAKESKLTGFGKRRVTRRLIKAIREGKITLSGPLAPKTGTGENP